MSSTVDRLTPQQWETLLAGLDEPTVGDLVAAVDENSLIDGDAEAMVEAALDDELLVEDDSGSFGHIELTADPTDEEPATNGAKPGEEPPTSAEDTVDKFRQIYLDAAARADRETWEYVEEAAIREALEAEGHADLLDDGILYNISGWQSMDVSDTDDDPRRRWYYTSGDEPRPDEFRRFDELLTETAPTGYTPHYFRVAKAGKDPATQFGSWKTEDACLTVDEAVEWMEEGGNIGIAARGGCKGCGGRASPYCEECEGEGCDDDLVNVDIDDDEETTPADVPTSLRARSRSRTGWHTWYFSTDEIPNIPTDEFGEVRANWQYVLAPGSFVASTADEIPADADHAGYYTIEDDDLPVSIEFDDLPDVFQETAADIEADDDSSTNNGTSGSLDFDLDVTDLLTNRDTDGRFPSIFHSSDTGKNTALTDGKLQCFRHNVAHGALQAYATLSDVDHVHQYGCQDLGSTHQDSNAGRNRLKGDWRLVWGAWHEAKRRGDIDDDEPIPYNVLVELAVADDLVDRDDLVERDPDTGEIVEDAAGADTYTALPSGTFTAVLDHVETEYNVNPGREQKSHRRSDTIEAGSMTDRSEAAEIEDTPSVRLTPAAVKTVAGLGEDKPISDLDDRQKAAAVWTLIRQDDEVNICVRRDNAEIWGYDTDRGVWHAEGERLLRHAAVRALGRENYGSNVLAELKAQAKADIDAEVEADEFGVDAGTVAVANGLLDLDAAAAGDDDAIRELRPTDFALVRLPVEYDPTAECNEFAGLVDEWTETGRADALQEYAGYCLQVGDMPIHRALLLVGSGANGKGTFLHVVRNLLGSENTSSTELQTLANEKDAVADLYGDIANIDDDLSSRGLGKGLGMFKKLVGGDRVRARRLYEDGFEFDATAKHLYAANQVPDVNVSDEDEAFWRRWLLVEFPNHYPPSERDPSLRDRLTTDEALSGVLNWAIEGRRRLLENGTFTGEDALAHEKRRRWQRWGSTIDEFIESCVERDDDAPRRTTSDIYQVFQAWCQENGKDAAGHQKKLTTRLKAEDLGYGKHRIDGTAGTNGFTALGLVGDATDIEIDDEDAVDENNSAIDEFDGSGDDDDSDDDGANGADSGDSSGESDEQDIEDTTTDDGKNGKQDTENDEQDDDSTDEQDANEGEDTDSRADVSDGMIDAVKDELVSFTDDLDDDDVFTAARIAGRLGLSPDDATAALDHLAAEDKIERIGEQDTGFYKQAG